jgi:hypothetical protein
LLATATLLAATTPMLAAALTAALTAAALLSATLLTTALLTATLTLIILLHFLFPPCVRKLLSCSLRIFSGLAYSAREAKGLSSHANRTATLRYFSSGKMNATC